MRTVPAFPRDSIVVMTAWWPVSARAATPLPVWDEDDAARLAGTNAYVSWPRVVAVDARPESGTEPAEVLTEFAGRTIPKARRVSLERFFHLRVDAHMADVLMTDDASKKAALIALGRPLEAGDQLALVGAHVLGMEIQSGIWGTFWWHDQPERGPFAADRPVDVAGVWRNYLMDVVFDAALPPGPDGAARRCFNPWFEAKFPDGGHGNGLKSNCVSCHSRASYPRTDFLPILRGVPDLLNDPAFGAERLRTDQLWSIAAVR
jgi:hypothetical protein